MVTWQHFIDGTAYPPASTGLRGSHPGSFEVAHALRDGERFDLASVGDTDEVDLVVVGAGISGLAAAWFYRREHPDATILLLDNHDDFGGHAKRNEFRVDGRFLLGYGGSEALQSPEALYGPQAKELLASLGVDHRRFEKYFDTDLYPSLGLSRGQFFTKDAFGEDALVTGDPMRMVADDIPMTGCTSARPRSSSPTSRCPRPRVARWSSCTPRTAIRSPRWTRTRNTTRCPASATARTSSGTGGSTISRPTRSRDGRSTSTR